MAVSYQASFDLTNTMVPLRRPAFLRLPRAVGLLDGGTPGDELFDGKMFSRIRRASRKFGLSGSMRATWRESSGGPQLSCTLRIVPAMDEFASFGAALRLEQRDSEAHRSAYDRVQGDYERATSGALDPMCGGRARHRHVQRAAELAPALGAPTVTHRALGRSSPLRPRDPGAGPAGSMPASTVTTSSIDALDGDGRSFP